MTGHTIIYWSQFERTVVHITFFNYLASSELLKRGEPEPGLKEDSNKMQPTLDTERGAPFFERAVSHD